MYTTQCLLAFVALYVGLAHSWEFAVSTDDRLEFYINDTRTDTVRLDSQNPSALAYDEVHNTLVYVDKQSGNDSVCGYNLSIMEYKCYMQRSGRDIQGLAFDPITQYLFFTDTKEKSINWISLQSGSKNNVNGNLLIKLDVGIPTDIAVDSCRGYIYWINTNLTTSTIERARFDGSDREVVINATYKLDLHSLAIDQKLKKIYWLMPYNSTTAYLYGANLNGENKESHANYKRDNFITHPNVLTVSKKNLFVIDWCLDCGLKSVSKFLATSVTIPNLSYYQDLVSYKGNVGIIGNYKIAEQFEGIQECQLTTKIVSEYERPFCVHGVKVHGQSLCKCTPGYTGERCDVSACINYCVHGTCDINNEGLPECRCTAGYTGARCEVNSCFGYCSNNGTCSLNAASEPVCTCLDDYAGDRCEVADCLNYCFQGECSLNSERLPECRCYAGYTGARCEVNSCFGYCSNNGTCSLNAASEPVCTCLDDYAGDRCEVADCLNYCFQGECSLNSERLPECRCYAGYTGARCEVDSCFGYCSNNGTCSLNAASEPVCTCLDDYAGDRCEVADCLNYCFQGECSLNSERLPECRCTAGNTGARCEVDSCLGYCLNNGSCSMNEESEPFCECLDGYAGDRCELNNANSFLNEVDGPACQCSREDKNSTVLTTPTYYPALSNITLADLFANWRKPILITPVLIVEAKP